MKKDKIITIRLSEKTYNRIDNIRKQMKEKKAYNENINLTDSFIIRNAIITLDEKIKYLIYDNEIKEMKATKK